MQSPPEIKSLKVVHFLSLLFVARWLLRCNKDGPGIMVSLVARHFLIVLLLVIANIFSVFCSGFFSYGTDKEDPFESIAFVPVYKENVQLQRHVREVPTTSQDFEHIQAKTTNSPSSKKNKSLFKSTTIDPHDDYSDVGLSKPEENETTPTKHDYHYYYNSSFSTNTDKWQDCWVNLEDARVHVLHDTVLSNSYRKGITVPLQFEFPFYGHLVRNVTVTTGGFLFTGDHVHSWLAATQYIAPLMANFDPSLKNSSVVKYFDNGTAFTVQWENVHLKDRIAAGNFTFQVTLVNTGDIMFVYREIPVEVTAIGDEEHPVKVGLSDAYVIDRTIFFLRRKTIYEYHRVDLKKQEINNSTSIYFTALPTCVVLKDCTSCQEAKIGFPCAWCAGRCSDGLDRHRQDWILQGCGQQEGSQHCPDKSTSEPGDPNAPERHSQRTEGDTDMSGTSSTFSSLLYTTPNTSVSTLSILNAITTASTRTKSFDALSGRRFAGDVDHVSLGTAGIIGILFVVVVICGFMIWTFYAYKNPHSPSGQILIKYRPNQWHWPKGEARYTAASVHM